MRVGYSVASLLMLTAVAAVFLGAVRLELMDSGPPLRDSELVVAIGFIGSMISMVMGADLGAGRGRGGLGGLAGLTFGLLSTFLLVVRDQYRVVVIGAPILIAFAAVVRWRSGRPLIQPRQDRDENCG